MKTLIEPALQTTSPLQDTLTERLLNHPFIHGLDDKYIPLLFDCCMAVKFEAGQEIFKEGDLANRFYLIEKGKVQLEAPNATQGDVPIQIIGAGDVLGWSWLFPPYYWHFSARAIEPVTSLFLYGTRLLVQCEDDPELGYKIMKKTASVLIQRLNATRKELIKAKRAG